jgi:hypothetical protein
MRKYAGVGLLAGLVAAAVFLVSCSGSREPMLSRPAWIERDSARHLPADSDSSRGQRHRHE